MAGMGGLFAIGIFIFLCYFYSRVNRWFNQFMEEKYYDKWRAYTHFKPHFETSNWLFHRGIHNWQNDVISALATVVVYSLVFIRGLVIVGFMFFLSFYLGDSLETLLIGKSF